MRRKIIEEHGTPPGRWAVGVSGGADSVALLLLLHDRGAAAHVVHLDHQLRGDESAHDAAFVAQLARELNIPASLFRREEIESEIRTLPRNPSALYRALRFHAFQRVVEREALEGVMLAHHADDQIETIVMRLLRGSGPQGLAGMKPRSRVAGLSIARPLLDIRKQDLLEYLSFRRQTWREDPSNRSDKYARNSVRRFLQARQDLVEPLLALASACGAYAQWIDRTAPRLPTRFSAPQIEDLPNVLARRSLAHWLRAAGAPPGELTPDVLERLRTMVIDAATPARQLFPGNIAVRRTRGWFSATGHPSS